MSIDEMVFNANLSFWHKLLVLLGWHIQVRVCGPLVQWGITRKPLSEIDADCFKVIHYPEHTSYE